MISPSARARRHRIGEAQHAAQAQKLQHPVALAQKPALSVSRHGIEQHEAAELADSDEGNRVFRSDVDKDQSSAKLAVLC